MVCTLGNRRKFEEVQRCLDVIGFIHEVTETIYVKCNSANTHYDLNCAVEPQ